MPSVLWFRRDLRLQDNPALLAAADDGPVTALFVLDDALRAPSGTPRLAFLYRSLRALDADLQAAGGHLVVRHGDPADVVPAVARESGATSVHIAADFGPYGARRDTAVAAALGGTPLVATGSSYAVAPGRVTKGDGGAYQVYSAYYRSWREHGWRAPAISAAESAQWRADVESDEVPTDPELPAGLTLPEAGERAATEAWHTFRDERLPDYATQRDRPDLNTTSRLSVYLKYGALHPRTLLADLGPEDEIYRKELAWREFYADVLHHRPDSARNYYQPRLQAMTYATGPEADADLLAWQRGETGFPMIDAGMRQLLAEGWMHNRVRMIVASFLVKDLHIEWMHGARHFMRHLVDGDLASNQHGWQWVAGSGTDAAPYFRIFNPITQGLKFDPDGDYVRRYVPELRALPGKAAHEPWKHGGAPGYPAPIVDHAVERQVALERLAEVSGP